MHPLLTSTALGLIAAWPVGALGLGLGRLVERLTDDPRPRAAAWSLAYALPAGALAATIALTFAPASLEQAAPTAAIVPGPVRIAVVEMTTDVAPPAAVAPAWSPSPALVDGLAWSLVGLSTAGLLARGWRWNRGRRRLAQVRAAAEPSQDDALAEAIRLRVARLGVKAPRVRISAAVSEPLLAGARRPVILLPKALAESADTRRLALVCGHELAHLRRGDNWRIPAEEALAGLFWLVPPVKALRGRMLAAREAVCDLTALDGAAPEARRDYARVLVEALKMNATPSPHMANGAAFTGRDRNLTALRLSAILQPQGRASALRVGMVLILGGAMTAATGAGSLALAAQARRLAPPSPETIAAAEAVTAVAAEDAAPAAEAAEAAPARSATPAAEATAALAPMTSLRVRVSADPWPSPGRRPDPRPDPRPYPRPNPQPNPQSNTRVARDININVDDRQTANIEIRADLQQQDKNTTIYLGDVTLRGRLNPVLVNLKVNGRVAPMDFTPSDLARGTIERLEVTSRDISIDRKMTVNVVLKNTAP